jgi:hypothetical protein
MILGKLIDKDRLYIDKVAQKKMYIFNLWGSLYQK